MARIKKLSPDVAAKIAAGEVVEKPFNIVKELIENSVDAGASKIIVDINDGGLSKIKVTDNGGGMDAEDLPLALERFATSKAETVDDVYSASTFGFRGEALAAISSVSDFSIRSGKNGRAYEIKSLYGVIGDVKPAPAIQGTSIEALRIFENLPARRKFLKSSKSLEGEIIKLIKHFSLINPHIEISLISDSREIYHALLSEDIKMRAAKVFAGKAFCVGSVEYDGSKVTAAATIPSGCDRLKKDAIVIGVNGRLIKDPALIQAVIAAYYRLIPDKRYPAAVVDIRLNPVEVDANVHPAKLEVRFEHPRDIFSLVTDAVAGSFKGKGVNTDYSQVPVMNIYNVREDTDNIPFAAEDTGKIITNTAKAHFNDNSGNISADEKNMQPKKNYGTPVYSINIENELNKSVNAPEFENNPADETSLDFKVASGEFKIIGQIDNTYIVVETFDKNILFIDQHAAHERILFEKIQAENNARPKPSIVLHEPYRAVLTDEIIENIDKYRSVIESYGYAYKICGADKVDILRIPYSSVRRDIGKEFKAIAADLCVSGKSKNEDAPRAMLSCKSAIKAGDELRTDEMEYLVKLLFNTDNFGTCPHGRPIIYAMTLNELARKFYR